MKRMRNRSFLFCRVFLLATVLGLFVIVGCADDTASTATDTDLETVIAGENAVVSSVFEFEVTWHEAETLKVGTRIGTIVLPAGAGFRAQSFETTVSSDTIVVDETTGEVFSIAALDFEVANAHAVHVRVAGGVPRLLNATCFWMYLIAMTTQWRWLTGRKGIKGAPYIWTRLPTTPTRMAMRLA